MIKSIMLFLLVFPLNKTNKKPTMEEVHLLYQKAALEEKDCRKLIELLKPYDENNNPLLLGYKASATMLMAKHAFNPISKLKYFTEGKGMLENAIAADVENVELRLLRFFAQTNIPSFLGYSDNIRSDKKFILKSVPKITNINLKKYIVSSLEGSENLSEEEIQELKKN